MVEGQVRSCRSRDVYAGPVRSQGRWIDLLINVVKFLERRRYASPDWRALVLVKKGPYCTID
jgi:hypothetical protein